MKPLGVNFFYWKRWVWERRSIGRTGAEGGFTLIEMLVVVVIIATLAAMIIPRFAGRTEEAKASAAAADIESNLASALDLYELDNGGYPTTEQGLSALRQEPTTPPLPRKWKGPYLKKRGPLVDPWGHTYVYVSPAQRGVDYDLSSWGPDGVGGTPDDITNWANEETR
ncbi:MAG: type II secretion system major pseudopilin GspG [Elusimicrobia bacterium]|jgi:general secretion pathway protein G|nr:type II secretion system major pseudopilin GspG [Elusimicrobiota bacterium]